MQIDLEKRHATLAVGEFADFLSGPRDSGGAGHQGLWRAQLGTHWHKEYRKKTVAEIPGARFEINLSGQVLHRGWLISFAGRIDQLVPREDCLELCEIKTVIRTLPLDESELRADYGPYFVQLACYRRFLQIDSEAFAQDAGESFALGDKPLLAKLIFVEADTGIAQVLQLGDADEGLFQAQLERVVSFLEQRWRARERLRNLKIRPPFETFREGQAEALKTLSEALITSHKALLFEAPTGFGKTGVLLEAALGQMKAGHFDRLLYLTSKATGQLQVERTLRSMNPIDTGPDAGDPLSVWTTRPKSEHCVAERFHCVKDLCHFMQGIALKWERAGLARHYLEAAAPRDIESLRRSGHQAAVCPYEITRNALPFCDLWIGDFNYVFAPSAQGLYLEQPGFDATKTLLLIDEAHNLPARVADAFSHKITFEETLDCLDALRSLRAPQELVQAWDHWTHFMRHLRASHALGLDAEDDARDLIAQLSRKLNTCSLDYSRLDPHLADCLWRLPSLNEEINKFPRLSRLWWAPKDQILQITCLDASDIIGPALAEFGGVVLASATFGPIDAYEQALGLDKHEALKPLALHKIPTKEEPAALSGGKLGQLTKRDSKKLFSKLTTGAEMLRTEAQLEASACKYLTAPAPWRDEAYAVAVDLRVDTSFQHRERHLETTARTISQWALSAGGLGPVVVFFSSYLYAEQVQATLAGDAPGLRVCMQPRKCELSEQAAWMEENLEHSAVLLLILGSSFAESIDLLGGRVNRAMIVGPSLPEVNAIQQARMQENARRGKEQAFRLVYQIPGMQKVNQALGRLVRAPGQKARILLHCRRFSESSYRQLLGKEYRVQTSIQSEEDLLQWLEGLNPHR